MEPLYNGQVGAGAFVHYLEVSFIGRCGCGLSLKIDLSYDLASEAHGSTKQRFSRSSILVLPLFLLVVCLTSKVCSKLSAIRVSLYGRSR